MKISEATKKEQVLATDSLPVGAASSNQAYRVEMSQINKFVHNNTAATTCDYVEALDANGNPIKISKGSLMSLMYEMMGNPINQKLTYTYSGDLDDLVQNGLYLTNRTNANVPVMAYGHLEVRRAVFDNERVTQIFTTNDGNAETYIRVLSSSGWSQWKRLDNFGANTVAELASVVFNNMSWTRHSSNPISSVVEGWEVITNELYECGPFRYVKISLEHEGAVSTSTQFRIASATSASWLLGKTYIAAARTTTASSTRYSNSVYGFINASGSVYVSGSTEGQIDRFRLEMLVVNL